MNYVVRSNIDAHIKYDIASDYVYIVWLYVCAMWFDAVLVYIWGLSLQKTVLFSKLCH
jgi:hypothetical protein